MISLPRSLLLALLTLAPGGAAFAASAPLQVGDPAPVVTGTTETGAPLDFAELYRKQPYTLVYFYPKADTAGCTKQGCSLRDAYEALQRAGVAIVGVSHDDVAAQKAFKDKHRLPFTLVADPQNRVIEAFRVPSIPATSLAQRQAYLIKDGRIVWADYRASTDQQAADVLKVLADAKGSSKS